METTNQLLDRVKAEYDIKSDYALAPLLRCSRAAVSNYRTRGTLLSDELAIWVADLLNEDRAYILACVAYERAKSDVAKTAWAHMADVAKRYGAAAVLALLLAPPLAISFSEKASANSNLQQVGSGRVYIMFNRWRGYFRRLFALTMRGFFASCPA